MNERAIDHLTVMVINCCAIAAMVYLITHDLAWWSLPFLFAFCSSSKTAKGDDAAQDRIQEKP